MAKDKLLRLLDQNARLDSQALAVMLGSTKEEIEEKIAGYEADGVIRGYKALIDWDKTGEDYVEAIIEIGVTPKKDLGFEEIGKQIMAFDEVDSVYLMSGGFDIAAIVKGATFQDIALFVAYRLAVLESVCSTSTHFVLKRYKDKGISFCEEETDERSYI